MSCLELFPTHRRRVRSHAVPCTTPAVEHKESIKISPQTRPKRLHRTRQLIQAPCTSALAPNTPFSPYLMRVTYARPLNPVSVAFVPFGKVLNNSSSSSCRVLSGFPEVTCINGQAPRSGELELELIRTKMTQKPVLRVEWACVCNAQRA